MKYLIVLFLILAMCSQVWAAQVPFQVADEDGIVHLFNAVTVCETLCSGVEMIPWTLEEWEAYRDEWNTVMYMNLGYNQGEAICKEKCYLEWRYMGVEE